MDSDLPQATLDSICARFDRLCAAQDAELTVAMHSYGISPSLYAMSPSDDFAPPHAIDEVLGCLSLPARHSACVDISADHDEVATEDTLDLLEFPSLLRAVLDHPPRAPTEKRRNADAQAPPVRALPVIEAIGMPSQPGASQRPVPVSHASAARSNARPMLQPGKRQSSGEKPVQVVDVDADDAGAGEPSFVTALLKKDSLARQGKAERKRPRDVDEYSDEEYARMRRAKARARSRRRRVDSDDEDEEDADEKLDRTIRGNPYNVAFNALQRERESESGQRGSGTVPGGFQSASRKLAMDRRKAGKYPEERRRDGGSRGEAGGRDRGFEEDAQGDGNDVARTITRAVLGPARRPRFSAPRASGSGNGGSTAKRNQERDGTTRDDLPEIPNVEPRLVEMILNEALDKSPGIDWDDIAGLHFAKKCVMEAVIWPMLRPDIFTGLRGPPKGLLLFGPPGTGKTVLAKTIASKCDGAKFFSISASSLMSKWVGEGEKMVRALFAVAREVQPSIVFIDEIDSLLTQRTDGDQESSRRVKTEFLVQMDGAATSREDKVLVIGATNRPAELDEAARRRMVKRLYIPLPDDEARGYLVKRLLLKQTHSMTDDNFEAVVKLTTGYSGSDIYALCAEAALGPVRDLGSSIGTIDVNSVRAIGLADFQAAAHSVRASVAQGDLVGYKSWNETYGSFEHKE